MKLPKITTSVILIQSALLAVMSDSANGQTRDLIDSATGCAEITSDDARLLCYDVLFRTTLNSQIPEMEWVVDIQTSQMTDEETVSLIVVSNESVDCSFGRQSRTSLILRCLENTTSAIFHTQCHMASGHGGYGNVTYRVGDNAPETREFEASTNNRALGLWRGAQSIPFIQDLLGQDRLLVRMTPYGSNPIEVSFNITGIDEEIVPLREACNW